MVGIDEVEDRVLVVEMAELALAPADPPADLRHQARRDGATLHTWQGLDGRAAKDRLAGRVFGKPGDRRVDDGERQPIAGLGIVGPGEQTMAFEDDALGVRMGLDEGFEIEAELETGTAPGQPADLGAEDRLCQRPGILRGRDGDDGVRMHVVDMREGHEAVQRRVDGGGARIEVEGAVRQEAHHAVLVCGATIESLERVELVLVQRREAVAFDRADVAARSFHPKHLDRGAGQRIGFDDFGRRIAAAIICDALVGAEQVRAIEQLSRLVETRRMALVPPIVEKPDGHHPLVLPTQTNQIGSSGYV